MIYVFVSFASVIFLFLIVQHFIDNAKRKRQRLIDEAAFKREKAYYEYLFSASPEELSGMPDNIIIGEDGYPKENDSEKWGDAFTFYYAPGRDVYHKKANCYYLGLMPVHAWTVYNYGLIPCQKCGVALPDMSWFVVYRNIKIIMTKYDIKPKQRIFEQADDMVQSGKYKKVARPQPGQAANE